MNLGEALTHENEILKDEVESWSTKLSSNTNNDIKEVGEGFASDSQN